jgi:hypothetical protein
MHPQLEKARIEIWMWPDEDGQKKRWPTSVRQRLRKSKWEKRLADWIMATGEGLLSRELHAAEAQRVETNDGR